ncbi:sorting nexin-31-like isoform X1 [Acipenser ruthenus]|uniref:sorting nexin-31-like isoform X1 n=1 Tax=Acipenser ruthenus TaxID=7906 RepID=UPI00145BDAB0|nr:sorting nexin-31-like isoform X1 [Acipenser ruthenus]
MHFNIPATEEQIDKLGGRFVVYHVYLDGFLYCKMRYSDMYKLDEELRRVFGDCLPPFPPKYYLSMTETMADERRLLLEHYLQKVGANSSISTYDIFCMFLIKMQQETFKIPIQNCVLEILLPDGHEVRADIQSSDPAERVLEIVFCKMELPRQVMGYFSLFLVEGISGGQYSVLKKLAPFELPYVSLKSMNNEQCVIMIRKSYFDPEIDRTVMGSSCGLNLLYLQAVSDMEMGCWKPTNEQLEKLRLLQETGQKKEFLEVAQQVKHYGYMQAEACICDHPVPNSPAVVRVGYEEINCCTKLLSNQAEETSFEISKVRCWSVRLLGTSTGNPSEEDGIKLELRFEYCYGNDTWKWITIHTHQAFLLSTFMYQVGAEHAAKNLEMNSEMQIEMPDVQIKKKQSFFQYMKTDKARPILTRIKSAVRRSKEDNVFEGIEDKDL